MKCECESHEKGCENICPYDRSMKCCRDPNHKGNHFACGHTHKIYEWGDTE